MAKLIIVFLILQVVYVILNTITSILKIKSGKIIASISSAVCYAFYVYVLIATATDSFAPYVKAGLVAITNFVGVYVSMWVLEKFKKDKLWEIVATIKHDKLEQALAMLNETKVGFNYAPTDNNDKQEMVFRIYSKTQKESIAIKKILESVNAKYIVHEESVRL